MNEPTSKSGKKDIKSPTLKKISSNDLSIFCMQLSLILKAGIPLSEGLAILGNGDDINGGENARIKGVLGISIDSMTECVEGGATLLTAMMQANIFPEYVLHMVEIGESAGKLDSVLEALGNYYEREQFLKVKIRNSLMYPMFLFVIMAAVIILLVGKVFPIFSEMLESMGGSLSNAGKAAAMFSGRFLAGEYVMYSFLVLAVATILIFLFSQTKTGRKVMNQFTATFPLTKGINKKIAASRFANAVSMTLSSGMDMNTVMNYAMNLVDNDVYKEKIQSCLDEIEAGARLSDSFAGIGIFSPMYVKLIEIGHKTGTVDSVMEKIADTCGDEAENAINNATSIIEPLIIGILSIVIGVVLISVMIPLVQIMANIA